MRRHPLEIPRPPDAVLFDMDGVLVNTFRAWLAVVADCRSKRGLDPVGEELFRSCWGQDIQADCRTLFPGADPRTLVAEYDEAFVRHIASIEPEEGVLETVRAIRKAGLRTGVVTNSPIGLARRIIGQVGLSAEFDCLAGGDEVRNGKPDPEIVFLALGRLGASPHHAVLVGDTRADFEAARASGVPMVGYRLREGDARIERLGDLLPLLGLPSSTA